jgi:hypothetical protein
MVHDMSGHLLTCGRCGRRGVMGYEMVPVDPNNPDGDQRARCVNRDACQRRVGTVQQPGDRPGLGHEECAPAGSVAGLASELAELRRNILTLRGMAGQVEDLARVVGELAERVAALAARPADAHAVSWLDLPPDTAVAAEVLQQLVWWLGEVFLRYPDAQQVLSDCWLWHPDVVEELLWIQAMWHTAYRTDEATAAKAGDWHDRYRPGVVRRIKQSVGTCSLDNHLPRRGGDLVEAGRPVVPLVQAMQSIADWWGTHRTDPAPVPTAAQCPMTGRRGAAGGRR